MKKTIIVMPVANEETTMGRILDEILALPYDNLYIYPVIDSYSRDRTEEIIREREKIRQDPERTRPGIRRRAVNLIRNRIRFRPRILNWRISSAMSTGWRITRGRQCS